METPRALARSGTEETGTRRRPFSKESTCCWERPEDVGELHLGQAALMAQGGDALAQVLEEGLPSGVMAGVFVVCPIRLPSDLRNRVDKTPNRSIPA
jgi:hypothetical protein